MLTAGGVVFFPVTMLVGLCQLDKPRLFWEAGILIEKVNDFLRLACRQVCRVLSCLITDVGGLTSLWVVPPMGR